MLRRSNHSPQRRTQQGTHPTLAGLVIPQVTEPSNADRLLHAQAGFKASQDKAISFLAEFLCAHLHLAFASANEFRLALHAPCLEEDEGAADIASANGHRQ